MNIIERIEADTEGKALQRTCALFAESRYRQANVRRRYTDEPYIVHAADVVGILRAIPSASEVMLAAAWLHGLLDKTDVTEEKLERVAGREVARICSALSARNVGLEGNRAMRLIMVNIKLLGGTRSVQTLKAAEIIANTRDIVERDRDFARGWLKEKAVQIKLLEDCHEGLRRRAAVMVADALAAAEATAG